MLMAATQASPRKDPVARHTDGRKNRDKLSGKEPGKRYVLAFRGHADTGEQKYLADGWKHCRQPEPGKPGVRLARGTNVKPGEIIEESGHVLMEISEEVYAEVLAHGDDSSIGQLGVDAVEAAIIDRANGGAGMDDSMRGLARRFGGKVYVENETEAARPLGGH